MPDLSRIAETSDLPLRKLRYVLEHGLLPGGRFKSRGRGAVRRFTAFEAFGLVVATQMLEAGLKRALVRDCLAALCRGVGPGLDVVPLIHAFESRSAARVEVGDWRFVRLVAAGRGPVKGLDTGWMPLSGAAAPAGYAPLVTLGLDAAQLRGRVDRDDR